MTLTTPAPATVAPRLSQAQSSALPGPSAAEAQSITSMLYIALRDAALAGLVALALAVPVWSHKTVDQPDGLGLERRWLLVIGFIGAVFLLRLAFQYFFWSREDGAERLGTFARNLLLAAALGSIGTYAYSHTYAKLASLPLLTGFWLASVIVATVLIYLIAQVQSPILRQGFRHVLLGAGEVIAPLASVWLLANTVMGAGYGTWLLGWLKNPYLVAGVFLLLAGVRVLQRLQRSQAGDAPVAGSSASAAWLAPMLLVALGVLVATLPFQPFANRYLIVVAILILIYVMLGWGLNVVVGLAGLLDLGYVAFYAVGAYSFALIAKWYGLSFWACLPLAGILAAFWGVLLGFPVLRLRGDYLAIVTLAFGEIIRLVLINWQDVTGGPGGLGRIPGPTFPMIGFEDYWPQFYILEFKDGGAGSFNEFFGIKYVPVHRFIFLYYIILALALITNYVTLRLRRLPIGRAWEALREDEIACRSLGINTTNTKLTAFAIGAMFGGFAGSFYATWQSSISPESFNFMESAIILAIVVLGGMGSQFGVAAAAVVMIGGIEVLRNLEFAKTLFKELFDKDFDPNEYRMLVFGIAMVLIMLYRPRGFVGARTPSVFLKKRKNIGAENVKEGHG